MEIRPYVDDDRALAIAMLLTRQRHMKQHWIDEMLDSSDCTIGPNLVAADNDGVAGWGLIFHRTGMPEEIWSGGIVVSEAAEDRGIGSALHAGLLDGASRGVRTIRANVMDDDPRSLSVAEHWGYQRFQYGITSRFELTDLPDPTLSPRLELEACPELQFRDDEAVLEMLDAAETNPERAAGVFITPQMMLNHTTGGTRVGRLARVDGAPVGLIHGVVYEGQLEISYACVHPDFRGRGIALAMKQQLHLDARTSGATTLMTTNEAANTAIRSLNEKLGYRRVFGEYRLELHR